RGDVYLAGVPGTQHGQPLTALRQARGVNADREAVPTPQALDCCRVMLHLRPHRRTIRFSYGEGRVNHESRNRYRPPPFAVAGGSASWRGVLLARHPPTGRTTRRGSPRGAARWPASMTVRISSAENPCWSMSRFRSKSYRASRIFRVNTHRLMHTIPTR